MKYSFDQISNILEVPSRLEDCEVPAVLVCQLTIMAASSGNASLSFTISRYYFFTVDKCISE